MKAVHHGRSVGDKREFSGLAKILKYLQCFAQAEGKSSEELLFPSVAEIVVHERLLGFFKAAPENEKSSDSYLGFDW